MKDMMAPPPVLLPADEVPANIAIETAIAFPASPVVWATLAEEALRTATADGAGAEAKVTAYAFARTGYHRSLDRLRANGWKGWGPVPMSHEANGGVLRAIAALAIASRVIGDDAEYDRCRAMLSDADPASVPALIDVWL